MKKPGLKQILPWVAFTEGVGALSGFLTREGSHLYANAIRKPPLSPPAIAFPIVWVLLFALMGIGAARIAAQPPSEERRRSLCVFFLQLFVNFFWSILFFNCRLYGVALLWLVLLWLLILRMIQCFRRVDHCAAQLQIPYLLWVSFAAYLNLGVYLLQ